MDVWSNFEETESPRPRRRLAIVSTFDELCGIASYTNHLLPQLESSFDIEVMDLDQFLLKHTSKKVQLLAEKHVEEIAKRLKEFDCVNIQLEHGTLGRRPKDILRRLRMLAEAAPQLSITFHTVMTSEPMDWGSWFGHVFTGKLSKAFNLRTSHSRADMLGRSLYRYLKRLSQTKIIHFIAHSKREMRLLKYVYGLNNVHCHPLIYLSPEQAAEIRARTQRQSFPGLASLPSDAKLVGTFGFLSPYKGFETVIKALNYLPQDHHVLIFGGIHPQTIKKGSAIDPYVEKLLNEANIGRSMLDEVSEIKSPNVNLALDIGTNASFATEHPRDLSGRLHFMGVLSDDDFARAMSVCDTVVVPYMEVGQSASGPVSIALDMGCRVIASRTMTFLQLSRFHVNALEFFDIGNFAELAQRIVSPPLNDPSQRVLRYNTVTNAELYAIANGAEKVTVEPVAVMV